MDPTGSEPKSLAVLAKKHLSLPDETFMDFKVQWDKLTDQDKTDLRESFVSQGFAVK